MVYIAPTPTTTPKTRTGLTLQEVKSDRPQTLDSTFEAALEHARRLTEMFGVSNVETAIAWETVEELQSARARNAYTATPRVAFMRYCEENPDAFEARIYDC